MILFPTIFALAPSSSSPLLSKLVENTLDEMGTVGLCKVCSGAALARPDSTGSGSSSGMSSAAGRGLPRATATN